MHTTGKEGDEKGEGGGGTRRDEVGMRWARVGSWDLGIFVWNLKPYSKPIKDAIGM